MTTTLNGHDRTRKSLAAQIDRLDATLDGLADNLNDAVAQAVKEAVGTAVREAVAAVFGELLTNPKVLALMRDGIRAAANEGKMPPVASRRRSWTGAGVAWVGRLIQVIGFVTLYGWQSLRQFGRDASAQIRQQTARLAQQTGRYVRTACIGASNLRHFKAQLLTALSTGVALGTAAFFAQPWLAATLSGLGGVSLALGIQGVLWLHGMLKPCSESAS